MPSMDSHETTAGSSNPRIEPGGLQTQVGETLRPKAETSQTSKDLEAVEPSQVKSNQGVSRQKTAREPSNTAPREKNHIRNKARHDRRVMQADSSSSSSYQDSDASSSESDSDSTDSEPIARRRVRKAKKPIRSSKYRHRSRNVKAKYTSSRSGKFKTRVPPSSDSDSNSDSSDSMASTDENDDVANGRQDARAATKASEIHGHIERLELRMAQLQSQLAQGTASPNPGSGTLIYSMFPGISAGLSIPAGQGGSFLPAAGSDKRPNLPVTPPPCGLGRHGLGQKAERCLRSASSAPRLDFQEPHVDKRDKKSRGRWEKGKQKGTKIAFKRVDWVWDSSLYTYRLQNTADMSMSSMYDDYIFHVRRTFDCEGKYRATFVDVRSKLLRECLQDVIGNVRGASLVDETPKLDPNLLFLYATPPFPLHSLGRSSLVAVNPHKTALAHSISL